MTETFRQRSGEFRPLVAFDFDGTLTCRDSFRAFLAWRRGHGAYLAGMAHLVPDALKWVHHRDRGHLKSAMVARFLKGIPREDLEESARLFAAEQSRALLRPDALTLWRRWQSQGARLLIVTASPEPIIAPFAHGLGADALIATRLEYDPADRVTGDLDGANCRGAEKVRRLKEMFGPDVRLEAAYGDSSGDRQMLAIADEAGMKVFGERP